jgi:ribosomal protein L3 glutamine methyltransferase
MESALLENEKKAILELYQRRIEERKPVPYLTNEAWFAGHKFYVDERVLVPRSPISELIAKQFQPWLDPDEVKAILDMATGSGCIAIACAYAFPLAHVDAADISPEALTVAARNVNAHGMDEQVRLIETDLFANLAKSQYDLIVTNPPYVDADEMAAMPPEYHHEPSLGLAAGDDGLSVIRRILRQAAQHLTESGLLVAEVGASQPALEAAFPHVPFTWVEFENGGDGVFVMTRSQLIEYGKYFK